MKTLITVLISGFCLSTAALADIPPHPHPPRPPAPPAPATFVITDLELTAEGTHIVGGGGCRYGYQPIGTMADCGGARCYGNQLVCVRKEPLNRDSLTRAITGIQITPQAARAAGPSCAPGLEFVGSVADCGNASCWGNQSFCVSRAHPSLPVSQIIADLTMTPEGTHSPVGSLNPPGYHPVGSVADCGGGIRCYGSQSFHAKAVQIRRPTPRPIPVPRPIGLPVPRPVFPR